MRRPWEQLLRWLDRAEERCQPLKFLFACAVLMAGASVAVFLSQGHLDLGRVWELLMLFVLVPMATGLIIPLKLGRCAWYSTGAVMYCLIIYACRT